MASPDRSKGNLAVNVGEELLERINRVAESLNKSQAEYVRFVLDERSAFHLKEVGEITKLQKAIAEREKKIVVSHKR
jgi:predicted DNA-binding protein